jgi:hypothetical protein
MITLVRADELILRFSPRVYLSCFLPLLISFPAILNSSAFVWFAPFSLLVIALVAAASAAQLRTPTRLAADGLHVAADRFGSRYHPVIRWEHVGRIWTNGREVCIRLHDPDAIAGANLALAAGMRRRRTVRGADLMAPLVLDRRTVEDAITRFSDGRLRLERAHVDPVPGTYDVAITDNRALPLLFMVGLMLMSWWAASTIVIAIGLLLPVSIGVAILGTIALALIGLRLAGPLAAPHIIAPDGLRVRVVHPLAHDLEVPWARVDRIWRSRHARHPVLLVRLHDADSLAGGDGRLRDRLRRNRARFGTDLIIPTAGSNMDESYLALAVAHRSSNTRELEHAA